RKTGRTAPWEVTPMLRLITPIMMLALTVAVEAANAAPRKVFRSKGPATLVELFTSEGCSSCPPADEWLLSLAKQPGLWTETVPVAFHVDYWDYLGWKDVFSKEEWSERQHAYGRAWRTSTVFT